MKELTMKEILPVDEFVAVRGKHQAEVLRQKVVRRLLLGDHMTFLFENRSPG